MGLAAVAVLGFGANVEECAGLVEAGQDAHPLQSYFPELARTGNLEGAGGDNPSRRFDFEDCKFTDPTSIRDEVLVRPLSVLAPGTDAYRAFQRSFGEEGSLATPCPETGCFLRVSTAGQGKTVYIGGGRLVACEDPWGAEDALIGDEASALGKCDPEFHGLYTPANGFAYDDGYRGMVIAADRIVVDGAVNLGPLSLVLLAKEELRLEDGAEFSSGLETPASDGADGQLLYSVERAEERHGRVPGYPASVDITCGEEHDRIDPGAPDPTVSVAPQSGERGLGAGVLLVATPTVSGDLKARLTGQFGGEGGDGASPNIDCAAGDGACVDALVEDLAAPGSGGDGGIGGSLVVFSDTSVDMNEVDVDGRPGGRGGVWSYAARSTLAPPRDRELFDAPPYVNGSYGTRCVDARIALDSGAEPNRDDASYCTQFGRSCPTEHAALQHWLDLTTAIPTMFLGPPGATGTTGDKRALPLAGQWPTLAFALAGRGAERRLINADWSARAVNSVLPDGEVNRLTAGVLSRDVVETYCAPARSAASDWVAGGVRAEMETACSRAQSTLDRMQRGLDYFGNPDTLLVNFQPSLFVPAVESRRAAFAESRDGDSENPNSPAFWHTVYSGGVDAAMGTAMVRQAADGRAASEGEQALAALHEKQAAEALGASLAHALDASRQLAVEVEAISDLVESIERDVRTDHDLLTGVVRAFEFLGSLAMVGVGLWNGIETLSESSWDLASIGEAGSTAFGPLAGVTSSYAAYMRWFDEHQIEAIGALSAYARQLHSVSDGRTDVDEANDPLAAGGSDARRALSYLRTKAAETRATAPTYYARVVEVQSQIRGADADLIHDKAAGLRHVSEVLFRLHRVEDLTAQVDDLLLAHDRVAADLVYATAAREQADANLERSRDHEALAECLANAESSSRACDGLPAIGDADGWRSAVVRACGVANDRGDAYRQSLYLLGRALDFVALDERSSEEAIRTHDFRGSLIEEGRLFDFGRTEALLVRAAQNQALMDLWTRSGTVLGAWCADPSECDPARSADGDGALSYGAAVAANLQQVGVAAFEVSPNCGAADGACNPWSPEDRYGELRPVVTGFDARLVMDPAYQLGCRGDRPDEVDAPDACRAPGTMNYSLRFAHDDMAEMRTPRGDPRSWFLTPDKAVDACRASAGQRMFDDVVTRGCGALAPSGRGMIEYESAERNPLEDAPELSVLLERRNYDGTWPFGAAIGEVFGQTVHGTWRVDARPTARLLNIADHCYDNLQKGTAHFGTDLPDACLPEECLHACFTDYGVVDPERGHPCDCYDKEGTRLADEALVKGGKDLELCLREPKQIQWRLRPDQAPDYCGPAHSYRAYLPPVDQSSRPDAREISEQIRDLWRIEPEFLSDLEIRNLIALSKLVENDELWAQSYLAAVCAPYEWDGRVGAVGDPAERTERNRCCSPMTGASNPELSVEEAARCEARGWTEATCPLPDVCDRICGPECKAFKRAIRGVNFNIAWTGDADE
jgi:hypothetical protein